MESGGLLICNVENTEQKDLINVPDFQSIPKNISSGTHFSCADSGKHVICWGNDQ